jgi:hypothetical protein
MAQASTAARPLLVNGVVLPGTGVLGLGWEAAASEPTFQVLPSTNIYALFNVDGPGGPVALEYSGDGGATWKGPAPLERPARGSPSTACRSS